MNLLLTQKPKFAIANTMERAIQRHKRWHQMRGDSLAKRKEWGRWLAPMLRPALAAAILFERIAWRWLIHLRPRHPHDAEQKLIYLMAMAIRANKAFCPEESVDITESLKGFEATSSALLGTAQRHLPISSRNIAG